MKTDSTDYPRAEVQTVSDPSPVNKGPVEYVGMRIDERPVILNLTEHERLAPDRSLDLVEPEEGA